MIDNNNSVALDTPSGSDAAQSKQGKNRKSFTKTQVLTRFTSCGRCSLFLAAYRIENEEQAFESAIANSQGNWLALPWNPNLRKLIVKSFGCHLDTEVYFFESSCPECQGKYRFSGSEDGDPEFLYFKI